MATSFGALQDSVLASPQLTVLSQAIGVDEVDPAGNFMFPQFFPFRDASSIDIEQLFTLDYRPVATRRAWDAHGKEIPMKHPQLRGLTMVPLEARHGIGEEKLHRMTEMAQGNQAILNREIMATVPGIVAMLTESVYRAAELEAAEAWAKGTITAKNPTSGATATTSLGFSGSRVQTAVTAWDDAGVNAYSLFIAWLRSARSTMGNVGGVVTSTLVWDAIRADAPNVFDYGGNGVLIGAEQLDRQVAADSRIPGFRFVLNDTEVDVFADGGAAHTRTRVWDESYIAAIPASGMVGMTYRASVVKAYDYLASQPTIDVRGTVVTNNSENKGKYSDLQCQANWLPVPDENNVFSIDTGIDS